MISLGSSAKAIILGCLTIVAVGFAFFVASPFIDSVFTALTPNAATWSDALDQVFWHFVSFFGVGAATSFGLGGYIAARTSISHPILHALVPSLVFSVAMWASVFWMSDADLVFNTIVTLSAIFASALGGRIGMTPQQSRGAN